MDERLNEDQQGAQGAERGPGPGKWAGAGPGRSAGASMAERKAQVEETARF